MAERTTTERLVQLVADRKVCNQASAARILGVTHQRIQQIVKAEGLRLGRHEQKNTLITWPCPDCGLAVAMWTNARNDRQSAYCQGCKGRYRDRPVPVMRDCEIEECSRVVYGKNFCAAHFARWRKDGDGFCKTPVQEYALRCKGCSEANCPNGHYAKGLCKNHHGRLTRRRNWVAAHA